MMPTRFTNVPRWVVRVCTVGFGATCFLVCSMVFVALAVVLGTRGLLVFPAAVASAAMATWVASFVGSGLALGFFDAAREAHPGRAIAFIIVRGVVLMTAAPALVPMLLGGTYDLASWLRVLERMGTSFGQSFFLLLTFAMGAAARVRRAKVALG